MTTQGDDDLIITSNGTVTLAADEAEGVIRVYSEQEPDMADWREALGHLRRLGASETISVTYADGPSDVFEVRLPAACRAGHDDGH